MIDDQTDDVATAMDPPEVVGVDCQGQIILRGPFVDREPSGTFKAAGWVVDFAVSGLVTQISIRLFGQIAAVATKYPRTGPALVCMINGRTRMGIRCRRATSSKHDC